jgi:hypothetical protein
MASDSISGSRRKEKRNYDLMGKIKKSGACLERFNMAKFLKVTLN